MSLVGPRPELVHIVDRIGERYHPRHLVRPGITGTWQIGDRQHGRPLHEAFDRDLAYLSTITIRTDLAILVRTIGVLVRRTGR